MISTIESAEYHLNLQKGVTMEVFLHKDVPNVGKAGQIIRVQPGFANNYIVPRGLGVIVTPETREFYKKKELKPKDLTIASHETSMLAEKIGAIRIVLKRKLHDDGKLYAAVRPTEVVDLLEPKGIKVQKNQIIFERPLKEKGSYKVTIQLSTKLKPQITLDIIAE